MLSIPPEEAFRRRPRATDRIEDKGLEFQRLVARGYARYVELVPGTVVIDGARGEESVALEVWREVQRALR